MTATIFEKRLAVLRKAMAWWRDMYRSSQRNLGDAARACRFQACLIARLRQQVTVAERAVRGCLSDLGESQTSAEIEASIRSRCISVLSGDLIGDTTKMVSDRERQLAEALSFYVRDEERFLNGEGEPFGSIPTEIGAFARSVRRDFELRLLSEEVVGSKADSAEDQVASFLRACCEIDPQGLEPTGSFYAAFQNWCAEDGIEKKHRRFAVAFSRHLALRHGILEVTIGKFVYFKGVRLLGGDA